LSKGTSLRRRLRPGSREPGPLSGLCRLGRLHALARVARVRRWWGRGEAEKETFKICGAVCAGGSGSCRLSMCGTLNRPGGKPGENLKSISHRCHPLLVVFVWELTKEIIVCTWVASRVASIVCVCRVHFSSIHLRTERTHSSGAERVERLPRERAAPGAEPPSGRGRREGVRDS